MFWRYLSQDVSKYNLNETSGDAHTCSDLSGAHICGLGSLRSTEGICLHVSTMQMYSTGPKLPWGLWRAVTSGLSVATSSNKLLCRLAASLYKADIGMHPSWCLQDMLKSSWGKGRNSAGDLTFLLIIGEFGLQGTSGGASPTWLSKQGWIQACGNTLWMPFQVFMAGISFSWKAEIVGLNHPWLSRIFSFQNVCPEYSPSAFMPSGLSSPQSLVRRQCECTHGQPPAFLFLRHQSYSRQAAHGAVKCGRSPSDLLPGIRSLKTHTFQKSSCKERTASTGS